MTINEITRKIVEEKNNSIAKAFTMQITSLLLANGITPVMTEYNDCDIPNVTDTDKHKMIIEYGIAFNELDTSEHDNLIRAKVLKPIAKLIDEYSCGASRDVTVLNAINNYIYEVTNCVK